MQLDAWQADLIRAAAKRGLRAIILAARHVDKSTTVVLCALWACLFEPGLILVVAPSLRQSSENFRNFMRLYRALDVAPKVIAESALRCELANGARVVSLPGVSRTIRGYSGARLVLLDVAVARDHPSDPGHQHGHRARQKAR
jgi:hypothetical protein